MRIADKQAEEPEAPAMALRTYRFLRISVVGVIAILIGSLVAQAHGPSGWCLKNSISAYYYSPVRSVFVGVLCAIGLVLVVLWGKTAIEDALFNLAGLLAPVVAFVPATDDERCRAASDSLSGIGLTTEQVDKIEKANEAAARTASHAAIGNNMGIYLLVVLVFLVALIVIGFCSSALDKWPLIKDNKLSYWLPLGVAALLWAFGAVAYSTRDDKPGDASWFYQNIHFTSAIVMFVFITAAILWIGITRWWGSDRPEAPASDGTGIRYSFQKRWRTALTACLGKKKLSPTKSAGWALGYMTQAALMLVGSGLMFCLGKRDILSHHVFWVELWMIVNVAVFWALQTKERWRDGAPPRTNAEVAAAPDAPE